MSDQVSSRLSGLPAWRWLTCLAAVLMLLPLPMMQYIGEESYYTLGAYEMFQTHQWWHQSVFGLFWPKTPLFNWLIIAFAQLTGWAHLEVAARLVSVFSSWGAAAVAGLMARRLYPQHANAGWLAALIYLSMGEVSFWYGWLGYADATFGFFIFAAIAALWSALEREHLGWFVVSLVLISLAFLTKNISAYALYGLAGLVLLWRLRRWAMLRRPLFLLCGLLSLTVPWGYQHILIHGGANATVAIDDALRNFHGYPVWAYLKHWLLFPAEFVFRALPVSLFLIWLWVKRQRFSMGDPLATLMWMIGACFMPFWLSAGGTPRYLMPLYGLVALLLTGLALQLDRRRLAAMVRFIIVVMILKVPYSLAVLPYLKQWRPGHDLKSVAEDILQRTHGETVRTRSDIASGLSVGVYMDVRLPPGQFIHWYRPGERRVFIMAKHPNSDYGRLVHTYMIRGGGGGPLYLYWKP